MKKNKMMRLASVLLIATLLTTSIISGTFAKYVTSGSVEDSARVAKFGVVVKGNGSLFDKTYFSVDAGNVPANGAADTDDTTLTIESSEKVVAPGAKNDEGLSIKVSGTPEVDVKITLAIEEGSQDVWLGQTAYPDRTTAQLGDLFANEILYQPIVYTLKLGNTELKKGNLDQIKDFLKTYSLYVDANTDMATNAANYTYTLTWAWDFDANGAGTYDKQDTLLGDIAAFRNGYVCNFETLGEGEGVILEQGVHYNIDVNVKLSVTVTQVD